MGRGRSEAGSVGGEKRCEAMRYFGQTGFPSCGSTPQCVSKTLRRVAVSSRFDCHQEWCEGLAYFDCQSRGCGFETRRPDHSGRSSTVEHLRSPPASFSLLTSLSP
jgi:hypothetical protein